MSDDVDTALNHADWWSNNYPTQTDMTTTEAFRVLAAEVRRLREIEAQVEELKSRV